MDHDKLVRRLNSVGKQAFVDYYELFEKHSQGRFSKDEVINELERCGVSNPAGAAIRAGSAKAIFDAGLELAALAIVVQSRRVPASTSEAARRLLRLRE
ncbi:hypothetical protein IMZ29_03890 [Achromobacter sp. GG226]|uniref:hypothetical protein n=1 Tax=Verticiella alkaliphila TaxID=2779529 RepID=UPI001C0E26F4|nr:hypothetical protein [Verticiella sp. GG226]MBU4609720.1 hypothetical protein [Verticiella sp. GG226]